MESSVIPLFDHYKSRNHPRTPQKGPTGRSSKGPVIHVGQDPEAAGASIAPLSQLHLRRGAAAAAVPDRGRGRATAVDVIDAVQGRPFDDQKEDSLPGHPDLGFYS